MSRPVEPAVLYAEHTDEHGQVWGLALVRTRWPSEGQCLLERTTPENDIDLVEQGAWFRRSGDEGTALLKLDLNNIEDEVDAATVNLLLGKLVKLGASWGFDAYEALP